MTKKNIPTPPYAEEGMRLQLFLEREGISQVEFSKICEESQPAVSRWASGKRAIPLHIWKILHIKYGCSYTWAFHGTGNRKVGKSDDKKLLRDIADITTGMALMMQSQDAMRDTINKLARDFYAEKHIK